MKATAKLFTAPPVGASGDAEESAPPEKLRSLLDTLMIVFTLFLGLVVSLTDFVNYDDLVAADERQLRTVMANVNASWSQRPFASLPIDPGVLIKYGRAGPWSPVDPNATIILHEITEYSFTFRHENGETSTQTWDSQLFVSSLYRSIDLLTMAVFFVTFLAASLSFIPASDRFTPFYLRAGFIYTPFVWTAIILFIVGIQEFTNALPLILKSQTPTKFSTDTSNLNLSYLALIAPFGCAVCKLFNRRWKDQGSPPLISNGDGKSVSVEMSARGKQQVSKAEGGSNSGEVDILAVEERVIRLHRALADEMERLCELKKKRAA